MNFAALFKERGIILLVVADGHSLARQKDITASGKVQWQDFLKCHNAMEI